MLFFLLLSIAINVVFAIEFGKNKYQKFLLQQQNSDIMTQLLESLHNDSGWRYIPPNDKENTADAYRNDNVGLEFSLSRSLRGGPRLYQPFYYKFSDAELIIMDEAVSKWAARSIMSKRIDALNREVDAILLPETTETKPKTQSVSRSKRK